MMIGPARINSGAGFTNRFGDHCSNLDVVEYGGRIGILLDATHDGDAYILFRDTKEMEIVGWCHLRKVQEIAP